APSPKAAAGVTSQAIERIDLSTGKVVATVRLGHPTHGDRISQNIDVPIPAQRSVAISDEGSVWVTNGDDGTVTRIDPLTNRAVTIRLPHTVWAVAVGNGLVWVTSDIANEIYAIDPATNKLVKQIPVASSPGPRELVFDPATTSLWLSSAETISQGVAATELFRVDTQ